MVTLARPTDISSLDLDKTSIQTENGKIVVDEFQSTTVSGVYTIGEVTGVTSTNAAADRSGQILAERLFNGRSDLRMSRDGVAKVFYTLPPVGTCGLSE